MAKLQKEFEKFNELITSVDTAFLREKRDLLTEDIKNKFPDKCSKYEIKVNKSDLRFMNQGSYIIGTAIEGKNVDIDYAMVMPLDIEEHPDPRDVKKAVRDSLIIENKRIPQIKEPCVTVAYHEDDEEYMHIDFPVYAEYEDSLYLGRGKENSSSPQWEPADPEGLKKYFLNAFKDKEQLKRVVRYFKKWKQIEYEGVSNSHEVPPSVGLTILVCTYYVEKTTGGDDDLSALYYTMKNIQDAFTVQIDSYGQVTSASITCDLPVQPYSDVLYKMRSSSTHLIKLYKKIKKAVAHLKDAINLNEDHEAAKSVRKVLGDDFTVPEKNTRESATANKAEYNYG